MFKTPTLEITESHGSLDRQHDSLSSSASDEDVAILRDKRRLRRLSNGKRLHCRKLSRPMRAIRSSVSWTLDERARLGIFVIDPVHLRANAAFLRAFARHHHVHPLLTGSDSQPFRNSSSDDDADNEDKLGCHGVVDVSHMGFTTGSSEDEAPGQPSFDLDSEHLTANPSPSHSHPHSNPHSPSPSQSQRKPRPTAAKRKSSSTATSSSSNTAKLVVSSALPRSNDNSDQFPVLQSTLQLEALHRRVSSNYKNYPPSQRHGSTPLDIRVCPGAELLNDDEYVACCLLRIRPALYFHARNTLLHNLHHAIGYFRKSAAQKMLRIDVNKTGKLYEFLVRQGWIPEQEGGTMRPEPTQVVIEDGEIQHQL